MPGLDPQGTIRTSGPSPLPLDHIDVEVSRSRLSSFFPSQKVLALVLYRQRWDKQSDVESFEFYVLNYILGNQMVTPYSK